MGRVDKYHKIVIGVENSSVSNLSTTFTHIICTQHGLYSIDTALGYPSESKCEILLVLFTYYLKMRISTHTCQ